MAQKHTLYDDRDINGRFIKGSVGNPAGFAESLRGPDTGWKRASYETKLRSIIQRDILKHGRNSKLVKNRKCDTCPLRPIKQKGGIIIQRCLSYKKGKKVCPIDKEDWIWELKAYYMAEHLGPTELIKYNATINAMRASRNGAHDIVVKGQYGEETFKFAKLAQDAAGIIAKLKLERDKMNMAPAEERHVHLHNHTKVITPDELFGTDDGELKLVRQID